MTRINEIEIIGAENYHRYSPDDWYMKRHYNSIIRLKIKMYYV
jgi:hypothetical protein